ncbi:hypothetical protein C5C41_06710 [Rathayibacter sp. AY1E9]|nr:hypothetical protein C5C41_06710 [Rathayibacter sp. AY1E9]
MNRPSSQGQRNLIEKLAVESGQMTASQVAQERTALLTITFGQASQMIEKLKARKAAGGSRQEATAAQLDYLDTLQKATGIRIEGLPGASYAEANDAIRRLKAVRSEQAQKVKVNTDQMLERHSARERELAEYPDAPGPAMVVGAMDLIETDEELARLLND